MQCAESQLIVSRFFAALERLREEKRIRGKATVCRMYCIDRRNFYKLERDHASGVFEVWWLAALHRDYGVSLQWLMLGSGPFYCR